MPGAKERLLLALLAAGTPDAVSVDRLLDGLWNGDRPASARSSLHVHLVRLRSALEPQRPRGSPGRYVVRRGAGYSLAAAGDELDALGVGEKVSRGRALLAAGDAVGAVRGADRCPQPLAGRSVRGLAGRAVRRRRADAAG